MDVVFAAQRVVRMPHVSAEVMLFEAQYFLYRLSGTRSVRHVTLQITAF